MKVKIVQLDGSLMNLALGKLATYHLMKGDTVGFNEQNPDLIYYGAIFDWTAKKFKHQTSLNKVKIIFGGYPFNDDKLPPEAEFLKPAYDLWETNYSIGYTSRGCIRHCGFCIVPKKEGSMRDYQPISEWHDPRHKNVILLDNNFLASPKWRENLQYINDNKLRVSFNQGLDLRIMTKEMADQLKQTRSVQTDWRHPSYYFAFDDIKEEAEIRSGLKLLLDAGINPDIITVYVLAGYNSTFAEDYQRCTILWNEFHVHPFIMKWNKQTSNKFLNHFTRWANKPGLHRKHTFLDYCQHFDVKIPEDCLKSIIYLTELYTSRVEG